MFALLTEPYAMIQVSILLQLHRTVVANFVPGNFGLFRRNPWQPLAEPLGSAEPRLKNTGINHLFVLNIQIVIKHATERLEPVAQPAQNFLWGQYFWLQASNSTFFRIPPTKAQND